MFGDFGQLPPTADKRMYNLGKNPSSRAQEGFAAYRTFSRCVNLTSCMRQQNDTNFKDCLLRLRSGETTLEDYQLLSTRFLGVAENEREFEQATRLFPTRQQVNEYNSTQLINLKQPIAVIHAVHNHAKAKDASSNDAGGLERILSVAVNARVMLRANLWVDAGLVNGSIGTVCQIVYLTSSGPPALPDFLICTFDSYTGPPFIANIDKSVPIVPIRKTWNSDKTMYSRTALPISLAWGLTIHKCQGLTLPKVVVDLGDSDGNATGLSFVAMSRVRLLQDLLLKPFAMTRLTSIAEKPPLQQRKLEEERLATL